MFRLLMAGLIVVGFVSLAHAQEQEKSQAETPKAEASPLKQAVIDNPDDVKALRTFLIDRLRALSTLSQSDPDAAEKELKELQAFLKTLKPTEKAAQNLLASGNSAFAGVEQTIALARLSIEDLTASLEKNPDDVKTLRNYASKVGSLIGPIARTEPDKAEKLMTKAEEFLTGLDEKTEEEATQAAIQSALASIGRYKSTIEGAKKLLALIGTDAAKLGVEAWVNGKPLTDEDLKGKVVLLDFWAVWCGPCIATFPHLIEWDKKYDDLVIIGVTNYYNYAWDADAKRPKRLPLEKEGGKVAPEVEQEMLVEFAKQHKLTHTFALQTERNMSEHYGVTGIPEVVVIDRTGKIRLIKVGSGEANAKAIQEMIEKLIEE